MKNKIFILVLLVILINPFMSRAVFAQGEHFKEIEEVQQDIKIINLLNGLSLKREQEFFILNKAKEAKAIRGKADRKLESRKQEILDTYNGLKQEFSQGRINADTELTRRFRRQKETSENILRDISYKIDEVAKEVESNLEEFQIVVLKEYHPCIIPSGQSSRIGQADKSAHFSKILERARGIPEECYRLKKEEMIERIISKAEYKSSPKTKLDKQQLRVVISEALEQARQMDDIDFQLQKKELTEKIKQIIKPHPQKEPDTLRKIKRFLLVDNIIPILEQRIHKSS